MLQRHVGHSRVLLLKSTVPIIATSGELEAIARGNARVQEFTAGLTIRKLVVIPKKLVNVVAS